MTARTKVASWAGLMMVAWAPMALAQESECAADADCDAGFVCEVVGGGACPAIDCAPGETCDLPACDSTEVMGCVPGPCDTDADCGENQVCYKDSWEACSGSSGGSSEPCPSDGECPVPEPTPPPEESCTTEEFSQCIPRWAAPCVEAADCGPGFTCEPVEQCACSGGGSTDVACPPGETCPTPEPAPEPDCTCEATGENYCKLIETPCATDSECGDGMVCADAGGPDVACANAGAAGAGGSDPSEPVPADGGTPEDTSCEAIAADPEMLCVPADYESFGFTANDVARGEAVASLGGVEADGSATGGGDENGESPQDPNAADLGADDGSSAAEKDSGCSVTSARGATGQGLWLLLAAAFLVRRRRG